ncbi:MAG TPA: hypothetical protein VED40_03085 [Azospirillaceae bacterium]|nr:hypothetical protein [Azospirillaceae bacterium]
MSFHPRLAGVVALAGLLSSAPAGADNLLGSMLKQAAPGAAQELLRQNMAPAPQPAASPQGQAAVLPGPMGLAAGAAQPPLKGLGTDAVAVVEAVEGTAAVQFMDYVFPGQSIALGAKGKVTLSYLSGCLTETLQGGTATVGLDGAQVSGGKRNANAAPGCEPAKPIVLAEASEAGATVNRVTPFSGDNWSERAVKSAQPTFKWDKGWGAVTVRVVAMDAAPPATVWQVPATTGWVAYPAGAAALEPGMPYRVDVLRGEQLVGSALFSVAPDLDVPDTLANRVVPVAQAR